LLTGPGGNNTVKSEVECPDQYPECSHNEDCKECRVPCEHLLPVKYTDREHVEGCNHCVHLQAYNPDQGQQASGRSWRIQDGTGKEQYGKRDAEDEVGQWACGRDLPILLPCDPRTIDHSCTWCGKDETHEGCEHYCNKEHEVVFPELCPESEMHRGELVRQFMEDNLADTVTRILRDTGCAPERLELEITEGSMMEHPEAAVEKINELRRLGVTFSIDDFGTGYSSLSYLTRFRINNLKIDKSFILNITRESEYQEITRAIIAMAHNLKIAVIAEGVETAEHASFLRALGCDAMQGYHFSRPVPPEEFARLLEKKTLA